MENEIIDFLSQAENYRHAKEISSLLPKVERKYKELFWLKVKDKICSRFSEGWKCAIEHERGSDNLRFFKSEWNDLSVNIRGLYDNPHYGIYCIKNYFEEKQYIKRQFEAKSKYPNYQENPDWLNFTYIEHWNTSDIIERILPENSETYAEQIVELFSEYVENVLPICEALSKARL